MKKYTRYLLKLLLLTSPFILLFSIPLLDLKSSKNMLLPIQSKNETILLYFGYPGCGKSCPDTLMKLSAEFSLRPYSAELLFINILKDTQEGISQNYARAYHKSFRSPSLTKLEKQDLMNRFNIQQEDTFAADLKHSNYLFLLHNNGNRQWTLKYAFPDVDAFIKYKNSRNENETAISKL